MIAGRVRLTLPGQLWQVNLAQALIDYSGPTLEFPPPALEPCSHRFR